MGKENYAIETREQMKTVMCCTQSTWNASCSKYENSDVVRHDTLRRMFHWRSHTATFGIKSNL